MRDPLHVLSIGHASLKLFAVLLKLNLISPLCIPIYLCAAVSGASVEGGHFSPSEFVVQCAAVVTFSYSAATG